MSGQPLQPGTPSLSHPAPAPHAPPPLSHFASVSSPPPAPPSSAIPTSARLKSGSNAFVPASGRTAPHKVTLKSPDGTVIDLAKFRPSPLVTSSPPQASLNIQGSSAIPNRHHNRVHTETKGQRKKRLELLNANKEKEQREKERRRKEEEEEERLKREDEERLRKQKEEEEMKNKAEADRKHRKETEEKVRQQAAVEEAAKARAVSEANHPPPLQSGVLSLSHAAPAIHIPPPLSQSTSISSPSPTPSLRLNPGSNVFVPTMAAPRKVTLRSLDGTVIDLAKFRPSPSVTTCLPSQASPYRQGSPPIPNRRTKRVRPESEKQRKKRLGLGNANKGKEEKLKAKPKDDEEKRKREEEESINP
ncbi:hypothetical protein BDQ17DRAFT_1482498 [Cyathus striatus]|nr:hypothetical protein BDQ17DRAFT_1482498 [Cyathus striatus]